MNKTCLAKYNRQLSVDTAKEKIKRLEENGSIQIEYDIIAEIKDDQEQIKSILRKDSIAEAEGISLLELQSVQNEKGIWKCIAIRRSDESLIIYTGGTTEVLYYSIKA